MRCSLRRKNMAVGRDVRFALRALRGAPLVSSLAIACIGLGIGAVTTVYSTASAFTCRPLPQLKDPARLVLVMETPASDRNGGVRITPGTLGDLRALRQFSSVSALVDWTANIAGIDVPERVSGGRVSAEFFRTTGRTAALGRTFTPDDISTDRRVVVLSHGLWQRRFGGDTTIIGRSVRINGEDYQVLGVMPDDFVFPTGTQLWAPLALSPAAAADRSTRSLFALARLAPGVPLEQAAAAVSVLGRRIAADHPTTHKSWVLRTQPVEEFFGAGPRPFMLVLIAAVAVLRLVAQLLTESVLLALAGGIVGIALAWVGIKATAASVPLEVRQYIPGFGAIALDYRAMAVASVVSMLAGVAFGVVPALVGAAVDVNTALKDTGRSESRRSRLRALRGALVVGEIALALMLVVGAAL